MTDIISLKKIWNQFCNDLNAQGNIEKEFEFLIKNYQEEGRGYHNLKHIEETLSDFEEVKDLINEALEVQMAIWYHDIIYDSKRPDNEETSAEIAIESAKRLNIDSHFAKKVYNLIILTKGHLPSNNPDSKYLIDIDFGILGKNSSRFAEYEDGIKKEYSNYSDGEYKTGRIKVLENFLNRESIYQTEYFRNKYEEKARKNILNLIKKLENI